MGGLCNRYVKFVKDTQNRTLEEYLALFRRACIIDIILAFCYGIQAGLAGQELMLTSSKDIEAIVSLSLLVIAVLIWFCDAILMSLFKRNVEQTEKSDEGVERLILWKRIIVGVSISGLAFYSVHIVLENFSALSKGVDTTVIGLTALVLALKSLRILAVNSFSIWLRLNWVSGSGQTSTDSTAAAPTSNETV
jgi:small-conductance mechanosensitive channel